MLLLLAFAFVAGIVTILSPCILPLLPVILSGSIDKGKQRPWGIITGFILSFTFFTLFLSLLVKSTGLSPDLIRYLAVLIIFLFGLSLVIPQIQIHLEKIFSFLSKFSPRANKLNNGFNGGLVIGLSLGLVWTPCVGPILASVISLALVGQVTSAAFFITLSYAIGTAIPMLLITYFGQNLFTKFPWLLKNTAKIQQVFGILMILTAVAIYNNLDRKFQTCVLNVFPNYGTNLTQFEENDLVKNQLNKLQGNTPLQINSGRDTFEINPENYPVAPEIVPGGEWFNSDPLTLNNLRGQVVLLDFWTYSCINCIRTIPYLNKWYQKYHDIGFEILGVHSPEFEFEKDSQNLKAAIVDFELKYPIVQDNNFETWRAYSNRYWPAKYLIDRNGRIRYIHFGEGEYDETEKMIQVLLTETGKDLKDISIDNQEYQIYSKTPEIYLGLTRMEYLASPEKPILNKTVSFSIPDQLTPNYFAYEGNWLVTPQYSQPEDGSSLEINFESRELFLVAKTESGDNARIEFWLDDQLLDASFSGIDVMNGQVTINRDRLYKLIKLNQPGKHNLKLNFLDPGIQVFAFTFG